MSVKRALNIFRTVAKAGGPLIPAKVAAKPNVARASLYQVISTLEDENILNRTDNLSYVAIASA